VKHNSKTVVNCTKEIIDAPYDPDGWYPRAAALLQLGYPELAVGDSYKASMLCDAGLDYTSILGESVRLYVGMSAWILDEAVHKTTDDGEVFRLHINNLLKNIQKSAYMVMVNAAKELLANWDSLQISQKALKRFPTEKFFLESQSHAKEGLKLLGSELQRTEPDVKKRHDGVRRGVIKMRAYPWMLTEHLQRAQDIITSANRQFAKRSPNCTVAQSPLKPTSSVKANANHHKSDVLGVFATKHIKRGERVLVDVTVTGVTNVKSPGICGNCCRSTTSKATIAECCQTLSFCSQSCHDLAIANYHQVMCGKDFDWLYESAKDATHSSLSMVPLVFLRFLAICVQQGVHPLDQPLVSQLTPQYEADHICSWSMVGNIIEPINILQKLGIDVFADLRYDTHVLQTMWWRINNNSRCYTKGSHPIFAVYPLYSFFNHSCSPSVVDLGSTESCTVELFAIRNIRMGEEICTSYIGDLEIPTAERRKRLMPWLAGNCGCSRCVSEG
jgi:hypothetical protein